jgi:predicted neuraminidase
MLIGLTTADHEEKEKLVRKNMVSTKGSRQWQGIPAIERSDNGRLWCAFFSGGPKEPDPANSIFITTSNDDGASWCVPRVIIDATGSTRAYDPALWHDPQGRLWLFYNLADLTTQEFTVWAITTDHSDLANPHWSPPQKVEVSAPFAFRLNKPTVLATGEWLLPVTWARNAPTGWFPGDHQLQGVAISQDLGKTWILHGGVEAPSWALENMIVERRDGRLWMLIRNGSGILWESFSMDCGRSWSSGSPTTIVNPGARFFIRRLASGRLLLINTPDPQQRKGLCAYLSDLQDETLFSAGLELDPRDKVSYPDAVQSPDGLIYAVNDCDRQGKGEILLSVFSEEEILNITNHFSAVMQKNVR